MSCYVYEHWRFSGDNSDTGVPFYVGKGTRKTRGRARCFDFKRALHNPHYACIVAKLAAMGLEPQVKIIECGLTEADAHALEIERIAYWRSAGLKLTNQTDGGEGMSGHVPSVATRAKRSAALKGHPGWNKGKPHSAATRAKMSAALLGKPGHPAWNKGKPHSEATRAKMRGKTRSEATRAKISAAKKGKPPAFSAETRAARKAQWQAQLAAPPEMAAT